MLIDLPGQDFPVSVVAGSLQQRVETAQSEDGHSGTYDAARRVSLEIDLKQGTCLQNILGLAECKGPSRFTCFVVNVCF